MKAQHSELAAGRWYTLSLAEQLGNVGSEVSRALRWREKDKTLFDKSIIRALELLDLTIEDPRWRQRLKEIVRVREFLCGAWLGEIEYGMTLESLDRYFFHFVLAARKNI